MQMYRQMKGYSRFLLLSIKCIIQRSTCFVWVMHDVTLSQIEMMDENRNPMSD